jgi:hypothetical protein
VAEIARRGTESRDLAVRSLTAVVGILGADSIPTLSHQYWQTPFDGDR